LQEAVIAYIKAHSHGRNEEVPAGIYRRDSNRELLDKTQKC